MKRKVRIKTIPLLVAILVLIPLLTIIFFREESLSKQNDYVTEDTINDSIPVINTTKKIINPYIDSSVKIGKTYYDYKGESQSQENSITVHENTYIQNSGIDFTSDNQFDVISILEGTVISVKEDNLIGKTIEIKHDNGIISSYQSLSEVNVKKDDYINQGQVIGKSGTNELDKEIGNHLHLEIYENGNSVNPENYLNKEING